MAEKALKAAPQAEFDAEVRPIELDLLAFFQGIEAEAMATLKAGVKAGKTPDAIIEEVGRILDRPLAAE